MGDEEQTVSEVFGQVYRNRQYAIELCLWRAVIEGDIEAIKCWGKDLTGVSNYYFLEVPGFCEVNP